MSTANITHTTSDLEVSFREICKSEKLTLIEPIDIPLLKAAICCCCTSEICEGGPLCSEANFCKVMEEYPHSVIATYVWLIG